MATTDNVLSAEDAAARQMKVDAILSVSCGNCRSAPGETCNVLAALSLPVVLLDRQSYTCVHIPRLVQSVRLGRISYSDAAVQFGEVPAELAALSSLYL